MNKTPHRKKTLLIVAAALLLTAAAVAGVLLFSGVFQPKQTNAQGVVGVVTDNWDPGIDEKDKPKQSGTQIPGYSSAQMKAGDKTLKINIGNPKETTVGMFASVNLPDATVLYESPLLKPGQGATEVPLNKTLEKGTYDADVEYQCVLLDEKNTPLNAAQSGFKLMVE